jgi:hypothetical protein
MGELRGKPMMFLSNTIPPQERFEIALERVQSHLNRGPLNKEQTKHLLGWSTALAHAIFHMHPELREEGSFLRYFVSKQGARQGLQGAALTGFVDRVFRDGIPAHYFPEWFVKGEFKQPWDNSAKNNSE